LLLAIPLSCWNFGASFLEMLTDVQIILKWIIHDTFLIFLAQFMNSFITEVIIYGRSSNVSPPRDPMGSLGPKWWQINKREGQGDWDCNSLQKSLLDIPIFCVLLAALRMSPWISPVRYSGKTVFTSLWDWGRSCLAAATVCSLLLSSHCFGKTAVLNTLPILTRGTRHHQRRIQGQNSLEIVRNCGWLVLLRQILTVSHCFTMLCWFVYMHSRYLVIYVSCSIDYQEKSAKGFWSRP